MSFVVHVVVGGGAVADDLYVGPFRYDDLAERKALAIERAADLADLDVACMVRELRPGRSSVRAVLEGLA